MREYVEGWHKVYDMMVLINDQGYVVKATSGSGVHYRYVFPYRWNNRDRCWYRDERITLPAFRAGVIRGSIKMW